MPELGRYEAYIDKWHYYLKSISEKAPTLDEEELKRINMELLQRFFISAYDAGGVIFTRSLKRE